MKAMNDEMKKIISRFLFVSVIISCFTLLGAGTLTAKQRSEYNSYRTEYAVLSMKSYGSKIAVKLDEREYSFDLPSFKKLKDSSEWIYITPFSPFFFFGECIFDIFSH